MYSERSSQGCHIKRVEHLCVQQTPHQMVERFRPWALAVSLVALTTALWMVHNDSDSGRIDAQSCQLLLVLRLALSFAALLLLFVIAVDPLSDDFINPLLIVIALSAFVIGASSNDPLAFVMFVCVGFFALVVLTMRCIATVVDYQEEDTLAFFGSFLFLSLSLSLSLCSTCDSSLLQFQTPPVRKKNEKTDQLLSSIFRSLHCAHH